jgi:hypothetical protein
MRREKRITRETRIIQKIVLGLSVYKKELVWV